MPAIVGDILERPSGSGPAAAPTPPTQSSAGFPQVQHRSHVSAFKRARAQATRPGGGSASDAPAVQIASSSPPSPGSGPSRMAHRPAAPPPRVPSATGNGQSAEQILQQVQAENSARVSGMSEQERQTELGELEEMFGRDLLERLRLRREKHEFARETNVVDEQTAPAAWSTGTTRDRDVDGATREQAGPSLNGASKKGDATVRFAPSGSSGPAHVSENPLSPQAIHDRYFPEEAAQRPELDWLQAASTDGGSSSAVRFDLAGNVLSSADISSIGGDRGLHHHGDEPDSAGYTIGDILHLCTSTFTPQRTLMLSLLGKIIRRCEDYEVVVLRRIQRDKIEDAALRLGLSVVCSNERNIGVLREGIACLAASTTSGESDQPDRTARIAKLPLDALMPRLDKLLEDSVAASALDASSLRQLLSVVRVIAVHSAGHAAAVTTIVPTLAESFLAGCTWPAILDKAAGDELATAHVTLDVLDICVRWERENAQVLLKRGTLELLSRFIAVQPWLWTSRQDMLDQALPCTTLALGITESLNRYGLYGSAVQMFSEALHGIGRWVAELPVVDAGPIALDLGIAYFKLLRTWYICARDAHCMVVEHDLTWSQVNGMPWAEEALDVIEKTVRMESGAESNRVAMLIAAAAEVMAARLQGLQANRIVGWEKQRMETAAALQRSGVLDVVEELLSHAHMLREVSAELLAAMCRLLDETKLLASVLERASPDVDKLLQGAKPGTPFGLIKGHLAAVLLALADKSDVSKWAGRALAILSLLQPGDEALAMLLIDDLLDLAWPREELERAGHQHGLYILRPFLHYHVLPNLDRIVGPTYAEPKYLKRTTTLRTFVEPAQPPLSQLDEERKSSLGLPLQPDWLLRPLQELAIRTSSAAFTQLPPAWDASDLQLARGSLLFVKLLRDDASDLGGLRMGGPATMLAVMKTFLLEIRPKDYDEETETFAAREEIFRDESMDGILTDLVAPYLGPHLARNGATTSAQSATIMVPGLASAAAFYQLYEAYIELYESVSFGHKLFGQLLLPPLSMRYPADYRRLFWVDHAANLLRPLGGNVFGFADVPLERGSYAVFFEPAEDDEAVLRGYVGAIVTGMVAPARGQFLFCLAGWHVAHFLWHGPSTPQQVKARTGAIKAIFGPSSRVSEAVKEWLLSVPAKVADSGLLSAPLDSGWAVTEATLQERRAVVETYLGR